jgi:gamma-glutamyltranspeptidase/glutathione hydrolase
MFGDSTAPDKVSSHYVGSIVADDPQIVDLGRKIIQAGGSAADAAAAMGFGLTVTQPARAGLAGGGVCLVRAAGGGVEELDFLPQPAGSGSVPGTVRGFATLQAKYGRTRWEQVIGPAEGLARLGMTVTPLLIADLAASGRGTSLPSGRQMQAGDVLPQRSVGATLGDLRLAGPGSFYTGAQSAAFVTAGVPAAALAAYQPTWHSPDGANAGSGRIDFPRLPGGAARTAWTAIAAAAPGGRIAAGRQALGAALDLTSTSTAFLVADPAGQAVGCALSMGRLFGSGTIVDPLGIYGAAPFDAATLAALAPVVAEDDHNLFGVFAGSGGLAAADTLAVAAGALIDGTDITALLAAPRGGAPHDLVNALVCRRGLPRDPASCIPARDPLGSGFALQADRLEP